MENSDLQNEWSLLQNQYDSYEKFSLLIKLANVGLLSAAYISNIMNLFIFCLILVLWLQDAIWKTFQSRIEIRLLQLENYLSSEESRQINREKAYQFNSLFIQNRPEGIERIKEYFRQAVRPTIAFSSCRPVPVDDCSVSINWLSINDEPG